MHYFFAYVSLRVLAPAWTIVVLVSVFSAPSASAAFINSFSRACAGSFGGDPGDCLDDFRFGDTAKSSVSHGATFVETDGRGGINYSAEAASAGVPGQFSLYAHAGGSSDGTDTGIGYAAGHAEIQFSDVITIAGGSGPGVMRIPWTTDGGIGLSGVAGANFGVTFCQLIPVGSPAGGRGCDGYPNLVDMFSVDPLSVLNAPYHKTWNLDFQFQFNANPVEYALNTTFGTDAGVGHPAGIATSDFLHTGTIQAAQFFDNLGNPISGVTITSQSGLNYLNPQATIPASVPEPASIALLGLGLAGLGLMRRNRANKSVAKV